MPFSTAVFASGPELLLAPRVEISTASVDPWALTLGVPDAAIASERDNDAKFTRSFYHDWQEDPFSPGAYSYVLSGGVSAQQDLARTIEDKLFSPEKLPATKEVTLPFMELSLPDAERLRRS